MRYQIEEGTSQIIGEQVFSDQEYENRLSRIREKMLEEDVDIFIAFGPENIFYLTGHDTPAYQYVQACVVTMEGRPVNVIRHIDASNTLYNSWGRRVVAYLDEDEPVDAILALVRQVGVKGSRIGLEDQAFFISPRRYAKLTQTLLMQGYKTTGINPVGSLRLVKSNEEIATIRRAARITEKAMVAAIAASHEGANENAIAAAIWQALVTNGGQFPGLPPFVTSGPRMCLAHATWSGRALQAGDCLGFEIPGVVNRYVAPLYRYVAPLYRCGTVGKPDASFEKLAAACHRSMDIMVNAIRPGIRAADIHKLHVDNFTRFGLEVKHRAGYSVGINYPPDWGEGNELSLTHAEMRPLQAGMVFHLVPGVYISDKAHIIISQTVLVTQSGCEIITDHPNQLFSV